MNLILLRNEDFVSDSRVRITAQSSAPARDQTLDRRHTHILNVHRPEIGDALRVGLLGGWMGQGIVRDLSPSAIELEVELTEAPPPPLPLTLFLALPRPKALLRILQTVTSLGVKQIYLMNAYRVEKDYWSCDQLNPEKTQNACILGLEQSRDTVLPEIHLKRRFKPFVEDEVPSLIENTKAFIAHPSGGGPCPSQVSEALSLAIGPEGGFIDYEVKKLTEVGFTPVHLTSRILKVETAIATLIGRLT